MTVTYAAGDDGGRLLLAGEIDHHAAAGAIRQIGALLDEYQPGFLEVDLSGITFMDSSGLALLLTTKRRMDAVLGELRLVGVPRQAARVLQSAGLAKLIETNSDKSKNFGESQKGSRDNK